MQPFSADWVFTDSAENKVTKINPNVNLFRNMFDAYLMSDRAYQPIQTAIYIAHSK